MLANHPVARRIVVIGALAVPISAMLAFLIVHAWRGASLGESAQGSSREAEVESAQFEGPQVFRHLGPFGFSSPSQLTACATVLVGWGLGAPFEGSVEVRGVDP